MIQQSAGSLLYTAASSASVVAFEQAISSYLAARTDTMALLDALLAGDPDMPMAACFRGYLLKLAAHPRFARALETTIAQAAEVVERTDANERERAHLEALRLWHADRTEAAARTLESILTQHPTDMLALRIAHYLHFYSGRGEWMRDSTARVLPAWREDHPHYGYLLGMHAFGLEESGAYAEALDYGHAAVAGNPADLWATHAVTHVYQMQSRHAEGVDWLERLKANWADTNNFRYHVIWHEALHWIGLREFARALVIYDTALAASLADDFYLDLCNGASLLWRLQFGGVDVGDRWRALAETSARHVDDRELPFASLHYLIPLAVIGSSEASRLLLTLERWAETGTDQGNVCRTVGLALANAIVESGTEPETAARTLVANRTELYRIGGSHAQRDLFRLLAENSARRANRPDLLDAIG